MPVYRPSLEDLTRLQAERGANCVPIYRQLTGDGLTPVSAFRKLHTKSERAFLFESVIGGERVGRYSFLGSGPYWCYTAHGNTIHEGPPGEQAESHADDPIDRLRQLVERHKGVTLPDLPRFAGGAVGVAGFDSVRYTEHLPDVPPDDRGLPDLDFGLYDRMVIFDHIRKTVLVVALARLDQSSPEEAYERASRRIDEVVAKLAAPGPEMGLEDIDFDGELNLKPTSNFTKPEFEEMVRRCQEYIKAGDIFQVVPSQRFQVDTEVDPFSIYRALRVINPSPFLFFLDHGSYQLIGSSPEIMVRVLDGIVTNRPLAGTRRRGRDLAEDLALERELLADPKELAEHVMLIDLGRNDVGRVAEPSTVKLSEVMKVERYSHVMHISSNVDGKLREGMTAFDALRAALPVGTVSGAPKVRAMQIIDELEPQKRGPYAGAVGYVDFTGNMDTCIALRTIVMQGKTAYVQAGAGIVYDSVPDEEYKETVAKARGMLRAIELAEGLNPAS